MNNSETLVYLYEENDYPDALLGFAYTGGTVVSTNFYFREVFKIEEDSESMGETQNIILTITSDACFSFIKFPKILFSEVLEGENNLRKSLMKNLKNEEKKNISSLFSMIRDNISENSEQVEVGKDLSVVEESKEASQEEFEVIEKDDVLTGIYNEKFQRRLITAHLPIEEKKSIDSNNDNDNNLIDLNFFETCEDLNGWDYEEEQIERVEEMRRKLQTEEYSIFYI